MNTIGPVFHSEKDSIDAHLTVVFAALAIGRHLQEVTGLSLKRLIHSLGALRYSRVQINGDEIKIDAHVPTDLEQLAKLS